MLRDVNRLFTPFYYYILSCFDSRLRYTTSRSVAAFDSSRVLGHFAFGLSIILSSGGWIGWIRPGNMVLVSKTWEMAGNVDRH